MDTGNSIGWGLVEGGQKGRKWETPAILSTIKKGKVRILLSLAV